MAETAKLIFDHPNGDPAVKFEGGYGEAFLCFAAPGAHPLSTYALLLSPERVGAIRDWCNAALGEAG